MLLSHATQASLIMTRGEWACLSAINLDCLLKVRRAYCAVEFSQIQPRVALFQQTCHIQSSVKVSLSLTVSAFRRIKGPTFKRQEWERIGVNVKTGDMWELNAEDFLS